MKSRYNPKTLFVSDLDGTLLNSEAKVSDTTAEIINKAISEGANFTIATARTPATVAALISNLDIRLPAAVMTGATLWNPHTGIYSNQKFILPEEVDKSIEIYKKLDYTTFIYTLRENHIHIYHLGEISDAERKFIDERVDNPYKTFHLASDGSPLLPDKDGRERVVLFYSINPYDKAFEAYNKIKENVRCTPLFYTDIYGSDMAYAEIFAHNSSKAAAIREIAEMNGFERIVAFGDNVNDLPMLMNADVAVVPDNALDEVKKVADFVIGDNNHDSVARFIESNPEI